MSLVIATACIDGKFKKLNYARLTIKNHKEYAEARNVSYACLRKRYPHMTEKQSKVTFVLNLLQSNEWVFFTDCDSLFMDFSVDIKHFFRHTNSDMIICGDKSCSPCRTRLVPTHYNSFDRDVTLRAML